MNHCAFIGRLTKDVEMRYTQSGTAVGNFTIAVDRPRKNAQGERETDFINIVVWGKTAEFASNYFSKGLRVGVTGSLQIRNWDDTEGKKHYVTEIVADGVFFADGKGGSSGGGNRETSSDEFEL